MRTRRAGRADRKTFSHLLAPGRIGPLTLSNRVVMPAMDMNVCHDGVIVEEGSPEEVFDQPREVRTRAFLEKVL